MPVVPEEEGAAQSVKDDRLPDFKPPPGLEVINRGAMDGYRLEQIRELETIKQRLAKDNCPQNMMTLQRAILMPELVEFQPNLRKYPTPLTNLMVNPFPKVKKKKKGKKKKKAKK